MGIHNNDIIAMGPSFANDVFHQFGAKETICNEGDIASMGFLVVSGFVKIYKTSINGKCQVVRFLQPGEWIAEFNGDEYRYSAEALENTTLRLWTRSEIMARLQTDLSFSLLMLENAIKALTAAEKQLLILGQKSAGEKVATYLLSFISQPLDTADEPKPVIDIPISRADIADYLGMSAETVCRKIKEFARCGIVDVITATKLRINNVATLRYIALADDQVVH